MSGTTHSVLLLHMTSQELSVLFERVGTCVPFMSNVLLNFSLTLSIEGFWGCLEGIFDQMGRFKHCRTRISRSSLWGFSFRRQASFSVHPHVHHCGIGLDWIRTRTCFRSCSCSLMQPSHAHVQMQPKRKRIKKKNLGLHTKARWIPKRVIWIYGIPVSLTRQLLETIQNGLGISPILTGLVDVDVDVDVDGNGNGDWDDENDRDGDGNENVEIHIKKNDNKQNQDQEQEQDQAQDHFKPPSFQNQTPYHLLSLIHTRGTRSIVFTQNSPQTYLACWQAFKSKIVPLDLSTSRLFCALQEMGATKSFFAHDLCCQEKERIWTLAQRVVSSTLERTGRRCLDTRTLVRLIWTISCLDPQKADPSRL